MERLELAFREFASPLLEGSRGILVGFSGGADSTALLHLLHGEAARRGIYLAAVHVNHGIRAGEADRDEAHCKAVCERLGIELHIERADIPTLAESLHKGLEETARDFRYEAFEQICSRDARLDMVATAHNADDNAETLIFNLTRGAGIAGLSGIPTERSLGAFRLIRPLIFAEKREIIEYCAHLGAEYILDSTNSDTKYTRNFVRHELIPRFRQLNPSFVRSAARLALAAREDDELLESMAHDFLAEHSHDGRIAADALAAAPRSISKRALQIAFARFFRQSGEYAPMLESTHVESLLALGTAGELSLPGRVRATLHRGELCFNREERSSPSEYRLELSAGINRHESPDFAILAHFEGDDGEVLKKYKETLKNIYKLSITTRLKSDIIEHVLYARSRIPGDRYAFGGMTRRLKVLFNGAQLTDSERASLPMICDGEGIVWVPGFPCADRARAGEDENALVLTYFH